MIVNNGTLTITDSTGEGKITFKDTGDGDANFGWGSYTIENNGTLNVKSGTIENATELNATAIVHMYCAIQQNNADAQTKITGGKISTPTYRAIRINRGKLTVSGGEIDGQIWVQAFDISCSVSITNGSFGPNGGDASALFIENAKYTVAVKISGGTFAGKIGCSKVTGLEGCITKCTITEAAYGATNGELFSNKAKVTKK